jgi:4-amino-4-deoxy-L-arabinose transferase-like glycosyltransferase
VNRFTTRLAIVAAIGLLIRLLYVYAHRNNPLGGDPFAYHEGANLLVHGKGFIQPLLYEFGHRVQSADHPPLYLLYLAIPSSLGLQSPMVHLVWSAFLGTGTIVVAGFLARRVGGERVGLITAVLVAIAPNIWLYDGDVLSETMAIFVTTVALLLAYRALARPSLGRICALGATCAAAALARSELALLAPALVIPIAILGGRPDPRTWIGRAAAGIGIAVLVTAPWVGYNLTRFHHPVYLSSQFEGTLAGANCDDTYSGPNLGLITPTCLGGVNAFADQSDRAVIYRHRALDFIAHHKTRVPLVAAARVGRVLGVYRPRNQLQFDHVYEGRERGVARAGLLNTYLFEIGAIAGFFLWRRRDVPRWPLVVLPALTVFTVALTYGTNRFRASAEVSLAVLTAVALDALIRRVTSRVSPCSGSNGESSPPS